MKIQLKRLKEIVKNSEVYDDFEIGDKGRMVVFKGDFDKAIAYLTSYGWVFAQWDNINNNYRCTFHTNDTPQNFCYCFARNLDGLAGDYTVKKFKSIYDAARAVC